MPPRYNVGDRLRIRQWDDMEAEFGLTYDGDIECKGVFTQSMRDLCGMDFVVSKAFPEFDRYYDDSNAEFSGWVITCDMLEYNDDPEPEIEEPVSPGDPFSGLFG